MEKTRKVIILGQAIVKYTTPQNILDELNVLGDKYDVEHNHTTYGKKIIAGEVKTKLSLYHHEIGRPGDNLNRLSKESLNWFENRFKDYLKVVTSPPVHLRLSTAWINIMHPHEHLPIHTHFSKFSKTGLSAVMILKLPRDKNDPRPNDIPRNAQLQFLGNTGGQFSFIDYRPKTMVGDFFIFPYDMRHGVYPFKETTELRRTFGLNIDTFHWIPPDTSFKFSE